MKSNIIRIWLRFYGHVNDLISYESDSKLLMHKVVEKGYLVRSDQPVVQLEEVLTRFDLHGEVRSFTRCIHCNGKLEEVEKTEVLDRLEPLTKRYYNRFARCMDCSHLKKYWN